MKNYQVTGANQQELLPKRRSRPITKTSADAEIRKRRDLYEELADNIDELTEMVGEDRNAVKQFYANAGNAFLFTRNSVLRHFFKNPDLIDQDLFNDNTDLLAILAAHDKQETNEEPKFEIGDPTIIIAGVKENENRTEQEISEGIHEFLFKTSGEPGDEYPPIYVVPEIGKDLHNKTVYVKFL